MKNILKMLSICLLILVASCKENNKAEVETSTTNESLVEANDIEKLEPPHWWVGFKNAELQLLVKHPNIGTATPEISYSGVTLKKVNQADSPNYIFLDFFGFFRIFFMKFFSLSEKILDFF